MSKTFRRNADEQFRKELSEAMAISPTRRAKEHRDALRMVRDFVIETQDEALTDPVLSSPVFGVMRGSVFIMPHDISDEYANEGYAH